MLDATIIANVEKLAQIMRDKKHMLVSAESCTGGGVAYYITGTPGSGKWFERGIVAYSVDAKEDLLGVKSETVEKFTAVSEEVVREMAEGALRSSKANISIAITGLAGPDDDNTGKPVGTVWFGIAERNVGIDVSVKEFKGDRKEVRKQAIQYAFAWLLEYLSK